MKVKSLVLLFLFIVCVSNIYSETSNFSVNMLVNVYNADIYSLIEFSEYKRMNNLLLLSVERGEISETTVFEFEKLLYDSDIEHKKDSEIIKFYNDLNKCSNKENILYDLKLLYHYYPEFVNEMKEGVSLLENIENNRIIREFIMQQVFDDEGYYNSLNRFSLREYMRNFFIKRWQDVKDRYFQDNDIEAFMDENRKTDKIFNFYTKYFLVFLREQLDFDQAWNLAVKSTKEEEILKYFNLAMSLDYDEFKRRGGFYRLSTLYSETSLFASFDKEQYLDYIYRSIQFDSLEYAAASYNSAYNYYNRAAYNDYSLIGEFIQWIEKCKNLSLNSEKRIITYFANLNYLQLNIYYVEHSNSDFINKVPLYKKIIKEVDLFYSAYYDFKYNQVRDWIEIFDTMRNKMADYLVVNSNNILD